ncbi:MAG: YfhO family protein [Candidatus Cyclobacteriaceae bacterium M3_2C_046]
MAKIDFKKHILPHLIAVVVFILAVVILYNPIFFENKEISQNDVLQGVGGGQELIEYRQATGEEGLWTNSMFSGMPGYLINVQWSGYLLSFVQKVYFLRLPGSANVTFAAMLSFYIMLLAFNVRPILAIIGGLTFGLNTFFVIGISAGHVWRMVAIAYMPLVIAGIHLTFTGRRLIGASLTALALGLEIGAKHPQMTYYLLIMVIIYGLVMLIKYVKDKLLKDYIINIGILLIAVVLAIGANIGYLWSTFEYGQYSMRGSSEIAVDEGESKAGLERDYAFRYSNSIFEPLTMIVPNLMGGASQQPLDESSYLGKALDDQGLSRQQIRQQLQAIPTYWGKQPLTAPYYLGVIVFLFFIISLFTLDKYLKYWLIISVALSIMLSWGSNFAAFNNLIFDILPGYNKFRSVTFTIIIAFLAVPLAGLKGLDNWLSEPNEKNKKKQLIYAAGILSGFLLLLIIFAGIGSYRAPVDQQLAEQVPDWFIEALRNDRASLLRSDALRSLIFVLIAVAILWFQYKKKISYELTVLILIFLVLIDMLMLNSRYLTEDNYSRNPVREFAQKTPADERILADKEQFRVLNLQNPFNEARTSYYHSSIGGYHGAKIRRYQDLIDHCIVNEISAIFQRLRSGNQNFSDLSVLNMLNTRYFYAGQDANMVFRNQHALGNAWLVNDVIEVNNPDEAIEKVCTIDPSKTAIVNINQFQPNATYKGNGSIRLIEYQPNQLTYQANITDGQALAVFSEIYYPLGWEAYIDGEATNYFRANYILRGMEVPSGEHTIQFRFRPDAYYIGNKVMMASSIIIMLVFAVVVIYNIRNSKI